MKPRPLSCQEEGLSLENDWTRLTLRGREQRAHVIAEHFDRLVRGLDRLARLEQLTGAWSCREYDGSIRFDHAAVRHDGLDRRVDKLRHGTSVLRRRVASNRVLLVQNRDLEGVFLRGHRSPPWACCLRNRTRSSICFARALACSRRL